MELGIARGSVTSWKKGTVPNNTTLLKIANYFGVSTDFLLGKTDEKEDPPGEIPEGPDEICAKIITLYSNLEENQKSEALSYLEFLVQKKQQDN